MESSSKIMEDENKTRRIGKVLVIEDDPSWSNRLRKHFEEKGFHVTTKTTKEEALKILGVEHFHFATIDLKLDETKSVDDYEGLQVLEEMFEIGAKNRMDFVVLSGHPVDDNFKKRLRKLGVLKFVKKSQYDKHKFIDEIIEWVDERNARFKDDYRD